MMRNVDFLKIESNYQTKLFKWVKTIFYERNVQISIIVILKRSSSYETR